MTQPRVIFVFGSNLPGQHVGGAARDAVRHWGAACGVGSGLTGEAYALPTMSALGKPLDIISIHGHILTFLEFAKIQPGLTFYVTPIGTGIAGYTVDEIAPLFDGAPANVQLPTGWRDHFLPGGDL